MIETCHCEFKVMTIWFPFVHQTAYSEVPNKSVTFLILFFGIFPTYVVLLGPTRLFIFGKSSNLHCFLRNEYQKNPTYTPLLRPTGYTPVIYIIGGYTFINF